MQLVIGITGSKASGKGEIAEFLRKEGFLYFSLSDLVREEAKNRGLKKWKTEDLQNIGNDLRKKHGNGILAKRAIKKIKNEKYVVIDGIRNLGEVEELRKLPNFYLIGIDADVKERFERIKKRNRPGDPKTWEEFLEMDKRDKGFTSSKDHVQQVDLCMNKADYMIFKEGSIEEENLKFKEQALELFKNTRCRRPIKDEVFMSNAYNWSKRSTCLRRKIGAVAVLGDKEIATGYNGAPKGLEHCEEIGCLRDKLKIPSGERHEVCRAVGAHAENNIIAQAAQLGIKVKGAKIYVTNSPCLICANQLINTGVKEVIYDGSYPDPRSVEVLKKAGIKIRRFSGIRPRVYHQLFR